MTNQSPDMMYDEHIFGKSAKFKRNTGTRDEQAAYFLWVRQLTSLAISRFKWTNLPETIDERFLELCLFHHALSVFYYNKDLDAYQAVQASGTNYVNFLQNPTAFTIIGPGFQTDADQQMQQPNQLKAYNPGTNYDLVETDPKTLGFPIWANFLRTPDLDMIQIYARRLAMFDRTIEINAMNLRQPRILKASQANQLSLTNLVRQQDQGTAIIVINGDSLSTDDIDVLDLAGDVKQLTELSLNKTRIWNEVMGLLGIDNSNQDKKERLVSSEVDANNGQTDSFRYIQLSARRQACDWINRVFGLEIEVDFNVEVEAQAKMLAAQQGINQEPDSGEDSDNG